MGSETLESRVPWNFFAGASLVTLLAALVTQEVLRGLPLGLDFSTVFWMR